MQNGSLIDRGCDNLLFELNRNVANFGLTRPFVMLESNCNRLSGECKHIFPRCFDLCRLREMLANEERDYIEEMEAKQETMEERQKKMAERAKVLKEKREIERQQIAQEKLDMQWR